MSVLGAVLAGGRSTRFGAPKAIQTVGGVRVVDRVTRVLRDAGVDDVIGIVNDASLAVAIGLPHRADILRDVGALAGVHAALVWARERGAEGVVAVACDMPFLEAALLRALMDERAGADAVIPESDGPRGVEPLCAYYGVGCIPAIEEAAARGDGRMIGFHGAVRVRRLPLETVCMLGEPALLFRNINSPVDHAAAERIAAGRGT